MAETIKPEARHAMRVAIWMLFAVYCLPLLAVLLGLVLLGISGGKNAILDTFVGFALMGDDSLSLVHRAILPLMAGLAPIAFDDPAASKSSTWLMVLLIAAIGIAVVLSAVFSGPDTRKTLSDLSVFPVPIDSTQAQSNQAFDTGMTLVSAYFNRTQETLGMYLLMLFGLTLTKKA